VAWVSLDTAVPLALLMLGFSAAAALAQVALFRRGPPGPAVKQAAH
jgi:hypothetical protein